MAKTKTKVTAKRNNNQSSYNFYTWRFYYKWIFLKCLPLHQFFEYYNWLCLLPCGQVEADPKILNADTQGQAIFAIYPSYYKSLLMAFLFSPTLPKNIHWNPTVCQTLFKGYLVVNKWMWCLLSEGLLLSFNAPLIPCQRALSKTLLCPNPTLAHNLPLLFFLPNLPPPDPPDQDLFLGTSHKPLCSFCYSQMLYFPKGSLNFPTTLPLLILLFLCNIEPAQSWAYIQTTKKWIPGTLYKRYM